MNHTKPFVTEVLITWSNASCKHDHSTKICIVTTTRTSGDSSRIERKLVFDHVWPGKAGLVGPFPECMRIYGLSTFKREKKIGSSSVWNVHANTISSWLISIDRFSRDTVYTRLSTLSYEDNSRKCLFLCHNAKVGDKVSF